MQPRCYARPPQAHTQHLSILTFVSLTFPDGPTPHLLCPHALPSHLPTTSSHLSISLHVFCLRTPIRRTNPSHTLMSFVALHNLPSLLTPAMSQHHTSDTSPVLSLLPSLLHPPSQLIPLLTSLLLHSRLGALPPLPSTPHTSVSPQTFLEVTPPPPSSCPQTFLYFVSAHPLVTRSCDSSIHLTPLHAPQISSDFPTCPRSTCSLCPSTPGSTCPHAWLTSRLLSPHMSPNLTSSLSSSLHTSSHLFITLMLI